MCLSSSIALGDMISEEDIFVGKISLLVLAIILCGALLFSIVVMYRRHTQEYLSELNTDQLLGATMTLQQFHHQRNGIIRNSGVCSICMVRQLHKLWPTPPLVSQKLTACVQWYQEPQNETQELHILDCSHCFHRPCIKKWVTMGPFSRGGNAECPLCKFVIATNTTLLAARAL